MYGMSLSSHSTGMWVMTSMGEMSPAIRQILRSPAAQILNQGDSFSLTSRIDRLDFVHSQVVILSFHSKASGDHFDLVDDGPKTCSMCGGTEEGDKVINP